MSQEIVTECRERAGEEHSKSSLQYGLDFSRLISMERSLRWPTAKMFWAEKKITLKCSYNRYAVIEKGTAKPSLDLARKIIAALGIEESSALHAWVRDLMPDEQCRNYFAEEDLKKSFSRTPLMHIDRARMELFAEHEFAFEMAAYISMHTYRGVSENELCQAFRMSKGEVKALLNQLLYRGVAVKNPKGMYEVPNEAWIQISDLSEFRQMKARLYQQVVESHLSSAHYSDSTLEIWCTRLLNQKQISMIRAKITALTSWIGMLPDEPDSVPYCVSGAGNPAQFGKSRKKIFSEERELGGNYFE